MVVEIEIEIEIEKPRLVIEYDIIELDEVGYDRSD